MEEYLEGESLDLYYEEIVKIDLYKERAVDEFLEELVIDYLEEEDLDNDL